MKKLLFACSIALVAVNASYAPPRSFRLPFSTDLRRRFVANGFESFDNYTGFSREMHVREVNALQLVSIVEESLRKYSRNEKDKRFVVMSQMRKSDLMYLILRDDREALEEARGLLEQIEQRAQELE